MKERLTALLLLFLAMLTIWAVLSDLPDESTFSPSFFAEESPEIFYADHTSPLVASQVIRLHILADNDSDADQAIKLQVRDCLLPYLNAATATAKSKEEALSMLSSQCSFFTEVVNQVLATAKVSYTATVSVNSVYFPIRIYGSQTYLSKDAIVFPPGFYDSVQVILGDGKGHNWWCLAYPSLCFIDSTYDYIPKESELYKTKISTVPTDTLWKLFYGNDACHPSETAIGTQTENNADGNAESDKITVYYGSKLAQLLKLLFQDESHRGKMNIKKERETTIP